MVVETRPPCDLSQWMVRPPPWEMGTTGLGFVSRVTKHQGNSLSRDHSLVHELLGINSFLLPSHVAWKFLSKPCVRIHEREADVSLPVLGCGLPLFLTRGSCPQCQAVQGHGDPPGAWLEV